MDFLSVPLVYVEIQPFATEDASSLSSAPSQGPILTAAFAKLQLQTLSFESSLEVATAEAKSVLCLHPRERDGGLEPGNACIMEGYLATTLAAPAAKGSIPLLHLNPEHPGGTSPYPCWCHGYVANPGRHGDYDPINSTTPVAVVATEATMVRVLPPRLLQGMQCVLDLWKLRLTGEWEVLPEDEHAQQSVLQSHSPETVRQLTLHLKRAVPRPLLIGTTEDALRVHRRHRIRQEAMQSSLRRYYDATNSPDSLESSKDKFRPTRGMRSGRALLVHSPDKGAGKTALARVLARKEIGCAQVHIIRPGPLLAKFGSQADTALETIVHEIALSAAFRQAPTCIILDDLDSLLPSPSRLSTGDAASPALNGIASYLKTLTQSLYERLEVPFPTKNPLYNLGKRGWVANVTLCVLAVVTCPDEVWQQLPEDALDLQILSSLNLDRFRLPTLTTETRLSAFRWALESVLAGSSIKVSPDLQERLPYLASSATWAHGRAFWRVAQQIRALALPVGEATVVHFDVAVGRIAGRASAGPQVEFLAASAAELFSGVGGNEQAKIALEDAISLDPDRTNQLARFGLSPPTGVLLYGPPGTGKTLLAKAVAKLLRNSVHDRSLSSAAAPVGGAFVSIKSSDVVRAEVGAGEKLVAEAFETARMNSPSVVFIDEFQALFTDRNSGGSSRMTTALLECMDDVRKWAQVDQKTLESTERGSLPVSDRNDRVVVLAATNTPWMIDKAFLRPGRFDRAVYVGLPDERERDAILRLYLRRMRTCFSGGDESAFSSLCQKLASQTEGYTGADLAAVCRAAAVRCLQESCDDGVDEGHLLSALEKDIRPSSSPDLTRRIEQWHLR